MKSIVTILLSIFIFISGKTQETKFLEFSVGWQNYQLRDEYQSPLRYKGSGFLGGIGYSKLQQDRMSSYNADFLSATLKNGSKNTIDVSNFQYKHPEVYHVSEQSGVNYFAGIALKLNFGFRSGTYISGFDTGVSLSLVGAATYKMNADDAWSHHASISIPFFAWITRPRYTSPTYVKKGNNIKNLSNLFLTIPQFFGVDIQMGSTYFLDNGNAFRFDYQGQYYQILPLHPVRVLTNGFKTTALMKIN